MADKVSKFIFPVKTGNTITDKEFDLPSGGSSFDGDYNSLSNKPTLGTASAKDIPSSGNASSSQVVMGNDSRLTDSRNAKDVPSWAKASSKPTYTASEVGAIATSAKGTANGVAELDSSGKVPSSQLPSYVDDVLEYDNQSVFPSTGETGKIYVAKDTNKSYRWTGSAYSQIKGDLALGETSSTAYRGDRGKVAYDHSQLTSGNPHGVTASDVGLSNVGNFKAVSTVASQGLSNAEKSNARANIGAGTSSLALGNTSSTAAKGDHNHDGRYYTEAEDDSFNSAQDQIISKNFYNIQDDDDDNYKSTRSYSVDDLCIQNGMLYRCITPCSAASWDVNKSCFVRDTLTNLVAVLNSDSKAQKLSVSLTPVSERVTINGATFYKIGKLCIADIIFTTNQAISGSASNPISLFSGLPVPISTIHVNAIFHNGEIAECALYTNGNFATQGAMASNKTCYLHFTYALA